jgi:hypothetical protein
MKHSHKPSKNHEHCSELIFYEIPHDKWRTVPVMEDERTQPLADHFHPQLLGYIIQQVEFQHCGSSEKET